MRFEIAAPGRIVFGPGVVREAGTMAKTFGSRALIVTGRDPKRCEGLLANLHGQGLPTTTFPTSGEPDLETVSAGVALAKAERCDVILAMGGGSALDTGKAISALLTNPGEVLDYLEVVGRGQALPLPAAPFIAIPTTAGTGSEVTRNAVLAVPAQKVKVSLRSAFLLPRVALVDPELTYELSPELTATTGMDALTQVIEPLVSSRANPVTDGFCREGIRRAARSLLTATREGQNAAAREDMAIASVMGGLALANAGLGAVHGFAAPIGGMFPAPHGAVCAALLAPVMAANLKALDERQPQSEPRRRFDEVAQILNRDSQARAADAVAWLRGLAADLQIPGLRAYGIQRDHFPEIAEKAAQASSMKANAIVLTTKEMIAILADAL